MNKKQLLSHGTTTKRHRTTVQRQMTAYKHKTVMEIHNHCIKAQNYKKQNAPKWWWHEKHCNKLQNNVRGCSVRSLTSLLVVYFVFLCNMFWGGCLPKPRVHFPLTCPWSTFIDLFSPAWFVGDAVYFGLNENTWVWVQLAQQRFSHSPDLSSLSPGWNSLTPTSPAAH